MLGALCSGRLLCGVVLGVSLWSVRMCVCVLRGSIASVCVPTCYYCLRCDAFCDVRCCVALQFDVRVPRCVCWRSPCVHLMMTHIMNLRLCCSHIRFAVGQSAVL